MNRAFEYNGTIVAPSRPVKSLKTVKKTVLIDSADRDTTKYYTNGDVVYYLPRTYENVVCIRLKSATFPRLLDETSAGALTHSYSNGQNTGSALWSSDTKIAAPVPQYFIVEFEGLNKSDETTVSAQRSTFTDNFFARIPVSLDNNSSSGYYIYYSDNSQEENIVHFTPPISRLDRLHILTRLHSQQDKSGFLYWTSDGEVADTSSPGNRNAEYSLVLEIITVENVFDDASSTETRIMDRNAGLFGC
jgi:hypothetical protein